MRKSRTESAPGPSLSCSPMPSSSLRRDRTRSRSQDYFKILSSERTSSCCLILLLPREGDHPIFLPSLPTIRGKRLFENRAVFRDARIGVTDENVFSVEHLLIKELAATVSEPAHRWRHTDDAVAAAGPIQVPLMAFRIIEAQTQTFQAPG